VIPFIEEREHAAGDDAHARAESDAESALLEYLDDLLELLDSGVAHAGVDVARLLAREQPCTVVRRVEHKGRGLRNDQHCIGQQLMSKGEPGRWGMHGH